MRISFARLLAVPAGVCILTLAAFAQSEVEIWKGDVRSDTPFHMQGFTAELLDTRNMRAATTDIRSDGHFEFQRIPSGDYQLVVLDSQNQVLYQNHVMITGLTGDMEIRLKEEPTARPPSGPVSVRELLHPPAPKAKQAMLTAQKYSEQRDFQKAALELEKAVRISPDCVAARTNLGAQYLRLGRYSDGVDQLQQALQMEPSALLLANLAYGQLMMSQTEEAIASARRAIQMDANFASAHYVLGMALVRAGSRAEAIRHLEKAAQSMPGARANLEKLRASAQ